MDPVNLLQTFGGKLLRILSVVITALILTSLIRRAVKAMEAYFLESARGEPGGASIESEKRVATVSGLLGRTLRVLLWSCAIYVVLAEAGFDLQPILAGAGVVGFAVGFGSQNLIRDFIGGMFMLLENQIRINDVAVINGTSGMVEEMNLRTTVLRSVDGAVHIFPNGQITSLSNLTREFSYYLFDLSVAYKEDTDHVIEVATQVAEQVCAEAPYSEFVLSPFEVLGVDRFAESAVVIRARIKTVPGKQWVVGRAVNRALKKRFDEVGIEIPFPQRKLTLPEGMAPRSGFTEIELEQLRKLVREVLRESSEGPARGQGG